MSQDSVARGGRAAGPKGRPFSGSRPYGTDPNTLVFERASSFAGGGAKEDLGRLGPTSQVVNGTPALTPPGRRQRVFGASREEGIPFAHHSLRRVGARDLRAATPAAARRPRLTSLAMMARRVVARRRVVKKWWAPSTNEAHTGLVPGASHLWQVRRGLVAKARASAVPKRARRVKGSSVPQGTLRTAAQIDVALQAGQTVETRTGRRLRRGRGFRARWSCPCV